MENLYERELVVPYRSIHHMGNCGIFLKLTVGSRACPHGWRSMASLHFLVIDHSDVSSSTATIYEFSRWRLETKRGSLAHFSLLIVPSEFKWPVYSSKEFLYILIPKKTRPIRSLNEVDDWDNSAEPLMIRGLFSPRSIFIYIYIYLSIVYLLLSLLCTIIMLLFQPIFFYILAVPCLCADGWIYLFYYF